MNLLKHGHRTLNAEIAFGKLSIKKHDRLEFLQFEFLDTRLLNPAKLTQTNDLHPEKRNRESHFQTRTQPRAASIL